MGDTKIQWTGKTWNPIRARNKATGKVGWFCEHVSEGCRNCYAEKMNVNTYFGNGLDYKSAVSNQVELFLDEKILQQPLHWRKPTMVFPCSMTDAFARFVPDEWLDEMLAIAAETERHTYQFLTKRADRALQYFTNNALEDRLTDIWQQRGEDRDTWNLMLPLKNVWLGVSVENQDTAYERIRLLLQTPASKHWVSAEPLLEPLHLCGLGGCCAYLDYELDWIVIGGESGPNARPFDLQWARDIIEQMAEADYRPVPSFVKQLGANPVDNGGPLILKDKKGGDINEWPEDLRVREFPKVS